MPALSRRGEQRLWVKVVALAFASGEETTTTFAAALTHDPHALCVAIVPSSEAAIVRQNWRESEDRCLSIVHLLDEEPVELALQLLALLPKGPVAVLIANFPRQSGLRSVFTSRNQAETIRRLTHSRPDVQVQVFSNAWRSRPPRIL